MNTETVEQKVERIATLPEDEQLAEMQRMFESLPEDRKIEILARLREDRDETK